MDGYLKIKIVGGRNFKPPSTRIDNNNNSDEFDPSTVISPRVLLKFKNGSRSTNSVKITISEEAKWNDGIFDFHLQKNEEYFEFYVFNGDDNNEENLLGESRIGIIYFREQKMLDNWYPFYLKNKKKFCFMGEIHIIGKYVQENNYEQNEFDPDFIISKPKPSIYKKNSRYHNMYNRNNKTNNNDNSVISVISEDEYSNKNYNSKSSLAPKKAKEILKMWCSCCNKDVPPIIKYKNNIIVWAIGAILFVFTLILSIVPFYIKIIKDVIYICPSCQVKIDEKNRLNTGFGEFLTDHIKGYKCCFGMSKRVSAIVCTILMLIIECIAFYIHISKFYEYFKTKSNPNPDIPIIVQIFQLNITIVIILTLLLLLYGILKRKKSFMIPFKIIYFLYLFYIIGYMFFSYHLLNKENNDIDDIEKESYNNEEVDLDVFKDMRNTLGQFFKSVLYFALYICELLFECLYYITTLGYIYRLEDKLWLDDIIM